MATQESSLVFLCEDLIINILNRLPEKDLIRFKCVSKEWLRIISHVCVPQLSVGTPVSGLYFRVVWVNEEWRDVSTGSPIDRIQLLLNKLARSDANHFIDFAPIDAHPKPNDVFDDRAGLAGMSLPLNPRDVDMLDCCNGLLLFVHRPKPRFYVCNPAVRNCVPISLPRTSFQMPSLYGSLAFDPSESIHYRIVVLSLAKPQCLHIFYSQTGEWITREVQVEQPGSAKCFKLVKNSVYLKGALYRLSLLNKILRIDLKSPNVYLIDCPYRKGPTPQGCIGVSNGCLSYANLEDGYLRIWLLDNPNEPSTWSLKYEILYNLIIDRVSKVEAIGFLVWLMPCAFHPKADIVFLEAAHLLLMYDFGSCRLDVLKRNGFKHVHIGRLFPMFPYTQTLVTLKNWCQGAAAINNHDFTSLENWHYLEQ